MHDRPNPVSTSSTPRRRGRAPRLQAALGLLAFVVAVVLGHGLLFARAATAAPPVRARVAAAAQGRNASPVAHGKCGKARAVSHAKHLRPHASSAALDDDDDDDDDPGIDSFAAAHDDALVAPAVPPAVAEAAPSGRAPAPRALETQVSTFARTTHDARGPPAR